MKSKIDFIIIGASIIVLLFSCSEQTKFPKKSNSPEETFLERCKTIEAGTTLMEMELMFGPHSRTFTNEYGVVFHCWEFKQDSGDSTICPMPFDKDDKVIAVECYDDENFFQCRPKRY